MLAEPDLRAGVPRWVARLRRGDQGDVAFYEIFGRDLLTLERRLYQRVRDLSQRPTVTRALAPKGKLEPWTAHDGGRWWSEGQVVVGQSIAGWSYLTTPVPLSLRYALTVDLAPTPGTHLGIVLGRHAVGGYPYHTLIAFDGTTLTLRRVLGPERVETLVQRPLALDPRLWTAVRLSVDRGVLIVSVAGEDVAAVRLEDPATSVFGVYVERGTARFRDPVLRPVTGQPTGPRSVPPPPPGAHVR